MNVIKELESALAAQFQTLVAPGYSSVSLQSLPFPYSTLMLGGGGGGDTLEIIEEKLLILLHIYFPMLYIDLY